VAKRVSIAEIYNLLFSAFGPQHWWPADTPDEVMAGAILTQNTNWENVERAITNLKSADTLSIPLLVAISEKQLAELIRPAGYYNIKAHRMKSFFSWYLENIGPDAAAASAYDTAELRPRMLAEVNGVGPETADSILLYALDRPVFVIDAYTRRILFRHGIRHAESAPYDELRLSLENSLPRHSGLFNEYHALFVRCAHEYWRRSSPLCASCPLHRITVML